MLVVHSFLVIGLAVSDAVLLRYIAEVLSSSPVILQPKKKHQKLVSRKIIVIEKVIRNYLLS